MNYLQLKKNKTGHINPRKGEKEANKDKRETDQLEK